MRVPLQATTTIALLLLWYDVASGWVMTTTTSTTTVPFQVSTRSRRIRSLLVQLEVAAKEVEASSSSTATAAKGVIVDDECVVPEEQSEAEKMMQQIKDAGTAGIISYAAWELAFWAVSVPVCIVAYHQVTGHWPNLSDPDDQKQLGAEAFAFVNFARFAVPLRIGLALGTTPWIQENIVDRFMKEEVDPECEVIDDEVEEGIVMTTEAAATETVNGEESTDEDGTIGVGKRLRNVRTRAGNLARRILRKPIQPLE